MCRERDYRFSLTSLASHPYSINSPDETRALALRASLWLAAAVASRTKGDRETARQLGRSTVVVEFLIALQPFLVESFR
jgi:hypothetical protein